MAFRNKKKAAQEPAAEKPAKKPTPAFLREDYPYQAVGEAITDMSMVRDGVIRRQPVSIGITTDTLIEIERGVEAGDRVIVVTAGRSPSELSDIMRRG